MRPATVKEQRKIELLTRRQQVQEFTSLSDFDYKLYQFEYGIKFLDVRFENHDITLYYGRCATYWAWWISEWNRFEKELLEFIAEHNVLVDAKIWHDEMDALVGDYLTEAGFENYLKLFHHVKL